MVKKLVKRRNIRVTKLLMGEGDTEKAFISYLKGLYACNKQIKVTPKSAKGKGPSNVIKSAIATFSHDNYDHCAVLVDTDIDWPKTVVKLAKAKGVILIASTPCIEGLLLDILGVEHCANSSKCKKLAEEKIRNKLTDKRTYESLFHKSVLDKARLTNKSLDELILYISK